VLGDHLEILRRVFSDDSLHPPLRRLERRSVGRAYLAGALASCSAGDAREARLRLVAALRQRLAAGEASKAIALLAAASFGTGAAGALVTLAGRVARPRWLRP
jgi:hypothetical protein